MIAIQVWDIEKRKFRNDIKRKILLFNIWTVWDMKQKSEAGKKGRL